MLGRVGGDRHAELAQVDPERLAGVEPAATDASGHERTHALGGGVARGVVKNGGDVVVAADEPRVEVRQPADGCLITEPLVVRVGVGDRIRGERIERGDRAHRGIGSPGLGAIPLQNIGPIIDMTRSTSMEPSVTRLRSPITSTAPNRALAPRSSSDRVRKLPSRGALGQEALHGFDEPVVHPSGDVGELTGPTEVGDQQLAERRMRVQVVQLGTDHRPEPLWRRPGPVRGADGDLGEVIEHRSKQEGKDVVLAREVVVERRSRHARGRGDVLHPHLLERGDEGAGGGRRAWWPCRQGLRACRPVWPSGLAGLPTRRWQPASLVCRASWRYFALAHPYPDNMSDTLLDFVSNTSYGTGSDVVERLPPGPTAGARSATRSPRLRVGRPEVMPAVSVDRPLVRYVGGRVEVDRLTWCPESLSAPGPGRIASRPSAVGVSSQIYAASTAAGAPAWVRAARTDRFGAAAFAI